MNPQVEGPWPAHEPRPPQAGRGPGHLPPALRPARTCSLTRPARHSPAPAPRTPTTVLHAPLSRGDLAGVGPASRSLLLEAPPSSLPCHPLGGPAEELRHLAQANVSMDIDTFTNLNPREAEVGGGYLSEGARALGHGLQAPTPRGLRCAVWAPGHPRSCRVLPAPLRQAPDPAPPSSTLRCPPQSLSVGNGRRCWVRTWGTCRRLGATLSSAPGSAASIGQSERAGPGHGPHRPPPALPIPRPTGTPSTSLLTRDQAPRLPRFGSAAPQLGYPAPTS